MFIPPVVNGLIVIAIVFILRIIRVKKQIAILTGFAVFGIILGLKTALDPPECGLYIFESAAVNWGHDIYEQSINHFGDPHSAIAHFTPLVFTDPTGIFIYLYYILHPDWLLSSSNIQPRY